jgi:hypothetical protein
VLGEISVPAGAGTDGATNAVNGLNGTKMPALQTDGILKWLDLATGSDAEGQVEGRRHGGKQRSTSLAEVGDFT